MFNDMGMGLFWESEELELGNHLSGEFEAASLQIVVFPERHAQSWLRLADLAFMLNSCSRIVSVIYDVKSEGVRYSKRVSADALHWNENKGRYAPGKLQEWKSVPYNQIYYTDRNLSIKEDEDGKIFVYGVLKVIRKVPLWYGRFW